MTNLILLIADDRSAHVTLSLALTRTAPDFRIEIADSRGAIEGLHTPTVILLDLMLAAEPAFDLLRWLRVDQRYKQVPVFVLAPQPGVVADAYALGANSCILRGSAREELEPLAQGIAAYASLLSGQHLE